MNNKTIATLAVIVVFLSGWLLLELAAGDGAVEQLQSQQQRASASAVQDVEMSVLIENQEVDVGVEVR